MISTEQLPAADNLIVYSFHESASEVVTTAEAGSEQLLSLGQSHRYGAEVCHLIDDMTLEGDCA